MIHKIARVHTHTLSQVIQVGQNGVPTVPSMLSHGLRHVLHEQLEREGLADDPVAAALLEALQVHGQGVAGDADDGGVVAEGADLAGGFGAVHVGLGVGQRGGGGVG